MNCTGWDRKINDYADGELDADSAREVEAHLESCADCRTQLDSLRTLLSLAAGTNREMAPNRDLWREIAPSLSPAAPRSVRPPAAVLRFPFPNFAFAAAIVAMLAIAGFWRWRVVANAPAWPVASVSGTPRVASRAISGDSKLRVGQWLETDSGSRAKVAIGAIGEVNLDPDSRLRLVAASPTDHRIELARGTLHAVINAPPRLFFVETPSATAIDIGCAYTLNVDEKGGGTLEVTSGYVALARGGRETIVRAGMKCTIHPGIGAGTPYIGDASAGLRSALDLFDSGTASALNTILSEARPVADAMTLWYLLDRVPAGRRGSVFDALAPSNPAPEGVTRAGIIAGDPAMLQAWQADLDRRQSLPVFNKQLKISPQKVPPPAPR